MTTKTIILTLAAAGGLAGGAAAGQPTDRAPGPVRTAVVAQVPEACAALSAPTPGAQGAAASLRRASGAPAVRAAAARGARVVLVCGPSDAQAAMVRLTAEGYGRVLWSGPDARAAAGLMAPDHPATRYAPLGG
jgi:hypothetical protein